MWSQSSKDKKIVCQKQIGKKEFRGYHEEQGSKHQSQMNGKIQRHSCKVGDVQWEMGRTSSMKRSIKMDLHKYNVGSKDREQQSQKTAGQVV